MLRTSESISAGRSSGGGLSGLSIWSNVVVHTRGKNKISIRETVYSRSCCGRVPLDTREMSAGCAGMLLEFDFGHARSFEYAKTLVRAISRARQTRGLAGVLVARGKPVHRCRVSACPSMSGTTPEPLTASVLPFWEPCSLSWYGD